MGNPRQAAKRRGEERRGEGRGGVSLDRVTPTGQSLGEVCRVGLHVAFS